MSQHDEVVSGVVFDMKNQKRTVDERLKVLEPAKKLIKVRGQIVFSDSPYQKQPPKPLHSAVTRSYVRFPYFHVDPSVHLERKFKP